MSQRKQFPLWTGKPALLLLFILNLVPVAQGQEAKLLITTESSFPSSVSNDNGNTVFGQSADKVHEILKRSHIAYDMRLMSWNRAFELARNDANTCVFATARTKDREAHFKWIGPISKGDWGIFGNRDKLGRINRLEDIRDANIGGIRGDVFSEYLVEKGYHVVTSSENEISLKNVEIGRLDYWSSDTRNGLNLINRTHLNDKIVLLLTIQPSNDYFLACNPQINDELIDRMRSKLLEIKADGTDAKIEAKYLNH